MKALKTMKTLRYLFLGLAVIAAGHYARAGEPTAQIRASTDRILATLGDPALKSETRSSEQRQLLRQEINQRVDWDSVARSSLGRHWAKRTRKEQAEFVTLFSRFLAETSIDKLQTNYVEVTKIEYVGEKIIDDCASVKTKLTTKDQVEHPVEFRVQKSGTEWRIYDVLIEGVSLVKNFRDQFDEILAKSPYEKLVADLRAKLPQGTP
jgi:phospholipid transport system substrate-binding protein